MKRPVIASLSTIALCTLALVIPNAVGANAASIPPRPANSAGSAAVGSAAYPVPAGAVFVSPSGSDYAAGKVTSPVKTIDRAVAIVPYGGTVVLRGGTYNQSVTINTKPVTIQNYPHEAAWLSGSTSVTGWVAQGSIWRKDGWTPRFDHSPTYTKGSADNTAANWSFVNAAHPMAARPDQMWIDGVPMRQVSSLAGVTAGTFYLSESTSKLYVGSNPVNHSVHATNIAKAITVRSAGTVLRGFGVTRFGPSVWMMGAITLERPNITMENMVVRDNATTGVSAMSSGITLRSTTVERSGMLGIHASGAYGLRLLSVASNSNNTEYFNESPVSGAFKVTVSRGLQVRNSSFKNNRGPGGWFDCSDYDMTVVGNNFINNTGHGISFELSAVVMFADNLLVGNGENGVKVNDTSSVKIWNNTLVGNGRPLNLVQDTRRASPVTSANRGCRDSKRPLPDPTVTWLVGPVTVSNNVIGQPNSSSNCLVCVEDFSHQRTAAQMGIKSNGNAYNRPAGAPRWAAIWSRGTTNWNPSVFTSFAAFSAATGQEVNRYAVDGSTIVSSSTGIPTAAVTAAEYSVARPLPADVAAASGWAANSRHLGAWLN